MAAQKAVEELSSKGLLDKGGMKGKLERMKKEANNHQTKLEGLIKKLSSQPGRGVGEGEQGSSTLLNSNNILDSATETEQKASQMKQTYLGNEPDSSEAIEFLCLAEAGEVTHYANKVNSWTRKKAPSAMYQIGQAKCSIAVNKNEYGR